MRALLEILRVISIIALVGTLLGYILSKLYSSLGVETEKYGWMGGISILILLFILYRNKLQFSGWYNGENMHKLSNPIFKVLMIFSVLLFLIPMLLSYLS